MFTLVNPLIPIYVFLRNVLCGRIPINVFIRKAVACNKRSSLQLHSVAVIAATCL